MEFSNQTPFPTLAFQGVDQHRQRFHVVVLRQTLTWNQAGELSFAAEQDPLCESDEYFDGRLQGSVRQESDLCQYKPRCDVLLVATAHPPRALAARRVQEFSARLVVKRHDTPAPLPRPPQGVNPFMPASAEDLARWHAAVAIARKTALPGEPLIDKSLCITAPRCFVRRRGLPHVASSLVRLASLGLLRPQRWRLTPTGAVSAAAVRLEEAFGGECRIESDSAAARKLAAPFKLTAEQRAAHPSSDARRWRSARWRRTLPGEAGCRTGTSTRQAPSAWQRRGSSMRRGASACTSSSKSVGVG